MNHTTLYPNGGKAAGFVGESRRVWLANVPKGGAPEWNAQEEAMMIQNAFGNRVEEMERQAEAQQTPDQKGEAVARAQKAREYFEFVKRTPGTPFDEDESISEWSLMDSFGKRLGMENVAYQDVADLEDSGLIALLSPKIALEFEAAKGVMEAREMQKRVLGREPEEEKPKLIPKEVVDILRIYVAEIKMILLDRLAESVEKETEKLSGVAGKLIERHGHELAPGTEQGLKDLMNEAKTFVDTKIRIFKDDAHLGKATFNNLKERLDLVKEDVAHGARRIREISASLEKNSKNPEAIRQRIAAKESRLRKLIGATLVPEASAEVSREVEKKMKPTGLEKDDTIVRGEYEQALKSAKSMGEANPEWAGEMQDPSEMKEEELLMREKDLDSAIQISEASQKAGIARKAIEVIQQGGAPKEIMRNLARTVGEEHVEEVSSETFEAKYRKHTSDGYMVFAIKGDQWRIIVDKDHLDSLTDTTFLKEQLTHELRHLEFEGDSNLNQSWRKGFLENLDSEDWKAIKAAFIRHDPNKTPSNFKENGKEWMKKSENEKIGKWPDEDVLSELYAMAPDWAFLSVDAKVAANHAVKVANFYSDNEISAKLAQDLIHKEGVESWKNTRKALEQALPERKNAEGVKIAKWSDAEALAELYAMPQETVDAHPVLSSALASAGIYDWLFGNTAKAKEYEGGEGEERILGMAKGSKEERELAEDMASMKKTKETLEKDLKAYVDTMEKYEKSPFLGQLQGGKELIAIMKSKTQEVIGKLDELDRTGSLSLVEEFLGKLKADLEGDENSIKNQIRNLSEKSKNPPSNYFKALWANTYIYSIKDFVAVYEHGKDYFTRYLKLKAGIHKGNLSKHIYEGVHEGLALESSSFISGAWKEAIQAWEEKLKSKDPRQLRKYLEEQAQRDPPDKAVVCAIINVMTEKGIMNWINKDLWICVNKLQTETKLDPNDNLLYEDENYLREKLKKAFGAPPLFNKQGAFAEKDRKNSNQYESNKKDYETTILGNAGLIGSRLKKLLRKRLKGDETIDAAEYEEMIELSIQNGLFDPEQCMFYLWSGMASGLLKPNTGVKLSKHWNSYPVMNFFGARMMEGLNTTKKIKDYVEAYFEKEFKEGEIGSGTDSKFRKFYWTVMVNDPVAFRRISKTARPGGGDWDHDWSEGFAMCGDTKAIKTILSKTSTKETEPTLPPNIYAGFLQWFSINEAPSETVLADRIGAFFMFKSIMSNAAFAKEGGLIRDSGIRMEKKPGGGEGKIADMTISQISGKLSAMMSSVPLLKDLFALATDYSSVAEGDEKHLAKIIALMNSVLTSADEQQWTRNTFKRLDDFYNNIGLVVAKFLSKIPPGAVQAAIRAHAV
jgi:hypothetical protein